MHAVRTLAFVALTGWLNTAEPVLIDGSSTVYPITIAIGEAYARDSGHQLQIGVSGTTSGFRLFTSGKIPITGASRPIRPDELKTAADHGITVVELPIAIDGLTCLLYTSDAADDM
jgi:phosphate transport system substrate-binding protein